MVELFKGSALRSYLGPLNEDEKKGFWIGIQMRWRPRIQRLSMVLFCCRFLECLL